MDAAVYMAISAAALCPAADVVPQTPRKRAISRLTNANNARSLALSTPDLSVNIFLCDCCSKPNKFDTAEKLG